jgi:hypothetical protein
VDLIGIIFQDLLRAELAKILSIAFLDGHGHELCVQ